MAVRTWQGIIDDARVILQDTDTPRRYPDAPLLNILNRGLHELGRLRPDAFESRFFGDDIVVPEVVVVDPDPVDDPRLFDPDEAAEVELGDPFDIPMMFFAPLVFWVAANMELVDDEFSTDGRVAALLGQFKTMVLSL